MSEMFSIAVRSTVYGTAAVSAMQLIADFSLA